MLKVANRKVIRRLSFRTMKEKRLKNLIAILAIALTTLLFTALFTVGASLVSSIEESTMRQVGLSAHGGYKFLTLEEYEKIKAAGGYEAISYDIFAGFAVNPELRDIQTEVRFGEDQMAQWSFCYPETGRMPREIGECAVSSKVLEALGVPMELGAKVPLSVEIHDRNGEAKIVNCVFTLCGFWQSDEAAKAQELWVSEEWLLKNVELLDQNYKERTLERQLTDPEGSIQAAVWLASSYDIEGQMEKLTERAGYAEDELEVSVNWAYAASTIDPATVILGIGLLLVIILAGYLIIYNIFYINVSTDIRYYGLLKTIGTTGRQIRRMVRQQAFMLSAAGIPLGLMAGFFVGKGMLPFIYVSMSTAGIRNVEVNPWVFAGAALFALLVVYLSCIRPCRQASAISPVEAVRYSENTFYKKKEKKAARRITMAGLAFANMGRNRRKAVVVILSLSLSLILLTGTYCLVHGFSFDRYVESYLISDMQISHYSNTNSYASYIDYEAVTPEVVSYAKSLDGVEAVHEIYLTNKSLKLTDTERENFRQMWKGESIEADRKALVSYQADEILRTGEIGAGIMSVDTEMLEKAVVKSGSLDVEKFLQGGYALVIEPPLCDNWIHPGDQINLRQEGEKSTMEAALEVMAVVEIPKAMGTSAKSILGADLLVSPGDFERFCQVSGALHGILQVEDEKEAEVAEALEAYLEENDPELTLTTKETLRAEFADMNNMMAVVGNLLGGVLAFIGILNLINAMITGILSRKQEFAMMQAVGMTGRQLRNMLTMEGIWYGVWTLGIAATVGNLISYGLVYLVGRNMNYFEWHFYPGPLLVSIPVILLISVLLPVICYYALCRKSIIERIRVAEV